jgi:hypothetical protein
VEVCWGNMGNDGKLPLRGSGIPETKQSRGQRLFRDVTTRNANLPYIFGDYLKNFNVSTN